jgi:hypothetical protein
MDRLRMKTRRLVPKIQQPLPVPYQVKQFFSLVDLRKMSDQDVRWLNNLVEVYHPLSDAQRVVMQGAPSCPRRPESSPASA